MKIEKGTLSHLLFVMGFLLMCQNVNANNADTSFRWSVGIGLGVDIHKFDYLQIGSNSWNEGEIEKLSAKSSGGIAIQLFVNRRIKDYLSLSAGIERFTLNYEASYEEKYPSVTDYVQIKADLHPFNLSGGILYNKRFGALNCFVGFRGGIAFVRPSTEMVRYRAIQWIDNSHPKRFLSLNIPCKLSYSITKKQSLGITYTWSSVSGGQKPIISVLYHRAEILSSSTFHSFGVVYSVALK